MIEIRHHKFENEGFVEDSNLSYFTAPHGANTYNLHFFCCVYDNDIDLLKHYEEINDVIAFKFQSELKKDIEKWNVYMFYFVKDNISTQVKRVIEQNKYATRKFVFDNFAGENIIEEQKDIIKRKVLKLDIHSKTRDSTGEYINKQKKDKSLETLLVKLKESHNTKEKKKRINEYLEGVKDESKD